MNMRLRRLLMVSVALAALCGLALLSGWATPGYAGGPEATPTCDECTGGMQPTPVPNTSSIVGFVYDYSTGPPVPTRGVGVTLTGCSWSAVWSTDDSGYFYFNNLGQGVAHVTLQLPPDGHAINPDVVVNTSGLTETTTVYIGFYRGNTPPAGPFQTPDGQALTGINGGSPPPLPGTTSDGAPLPGVGGPWPDSYRAMGLSAALLLLLTGTGVAKLARRRAPKRIW